MRRREFILALGGAVAFAKPTAALAQQMKPRRIGFLRVKSCRTSNSPPISGTIHPNCFRLIVATEAMGMGQGRAFSIRRLRAQQYKTHFAGG
jgi:hypothetical protein